MLIAVIVISLMTIAATIVSFLSMSAAMAYEQELEEEYQEIDIL